MRFNARRWLPPKWNSYPQTGKHSFRHKRAEVWSEKSCAHHSRYFSPLSPAFILLISQSPEEPCPMSVRNSAQPIHFLSLQTAIFCVQCELISTNTTPSCLACG